MPELKKLESAAAFTPASGNIVNYFAEEDGKIVLKVKKSDGSVATLSGGGGGGGGGGGAADPFTLAVVTEYTPYEAEHDEVTAITISGFPQDNEHLFGANGTYDVTTETAASKGLSRVYKQRNGEFYLWGHNPQGEAAEWDEFGKSWHLTKTVGYTGEIWVRGEALPEGQVSWESWNWPGMQTSVTHTLTAIPEQPIVLTGNAVTGYDKETGVYTFAEEQTSFSGTAKDVKVNYIYAVFQDFMIGEAVAVHLAPFVDKYTLFLASASQGGATDLVSGTALVNRDGVVIGSDYFNFSSANSALDMPIEADGKWRLSDFTMEVVYTPKEPTTSYPTMFSTGDNWENNAMMLRFGNTGNNAIGHFWNGIGDPVCQGGTIAYSDTEFRHAAVCRKDGVIKLFDNGIEVATATRSDVWNVASDGLIRLGALDMPAKYHGKIKWARISNIARYTENFTVPKL